MVLVMKIMVVMTGGNCDFKTLLNVTLNNTQTLSLLAIVIYN